ncbi:MAG: InlB B-repeat-containing protein [Clostridia bacterium]|nr:InlB B-repeat-containing protein [Clostridia bacterium]
MTDTRIHPAKRVITFIMALLMILSSFIYFGMPSVDAAHYEAANEANWWGWYECYIHPQLPSHGQNMINGGYNPIGYSAQKITSDDRHTNAGWDDFVAVASKHSTHPGGYDITMAIKTGKKTEVITPEGENISYTNYIADGSGHGAFSVGIMTRNYPSTTGFDYWALGVQFGFYDTPGYVLTFKAAPLATGFYNRCIVYRDGTQVANVSLPDNIVMANGTANTNIKLVKAENSYEYTIRVTNAYSSAYKDVYTIKDFSPDEELYYGVGAFCCSQNIVNEVPQGYLQTSPSFSVTKLGNCSGVVGATTFTSGGHVYDNDTVWHSFVDYWLKYCENDNCKAIVEKQIEVTYSGNGGSLAPDSTVVSKTAKHSMATGDSGSSVSFIPVPSYTAYKTGHNFLGWSTDPYATSPDSSFSSDKNYTLHAIYELGTYTLTLDPKGGTFSDGSTANKTFDIDYGQNFQAAAGPMPKPTRRGYDFDGWHIVGAGESAVYRDSWENNTFTGTSDMTLEAVWKEKTGYTLTFDTDGGAMPAGYQSSYIFYADEKFQDIIGGFPIPYKEDHDFLGWRNQAAGTADFWENSWGTQPYTFGANITLKAEWQYNPKPYNIVFNLNDDETDPATMAEGFAEIYRIDVGDSISAVVGGFPEPTRPNYTFKGWGMMVKDENGEFVNKLFTPEEGWGDAVHEFEGDVQIVANWRWWCDHKKADGSYYTLNWTNGEYRDEAVCSHCNHLAAYGYRVKFWSRGDFNGDGTNLRVCLSEGLSLEDLFKLDATSDNLIFDKATSRITDYIDDDNDPYVTIDFNPCLVASKNTYDIWTGWTYTNYYDDNNDGVVDSTAQATAIHGNKQGFQYIFDDIWHGEGKPLRNTHLNFYVVYADGYNEVVFDAGYDFNDNATADGVIVDSERKYGVMAIKDGDTYKDALYYIPTAKHNYNYTLYCSVGWKHRGEDHLIDCESWNKGETYQHEHDTIIYPYYWYIYKDPDTGAEKLDKSVGYLSTYFANNKYAHMGNIKDAEGNVVDVGMYNNAYFDPNENTGGTMYYIYYRPTDANGNYLDYSDGMEYAYDIINDSDQVNKYPVVCEPLFAYDPDEDYRHAFKYTPDEHDEYIADFNINVYVDKLLEHGVVIAKEPKRYTIYVGEGAHFTFPTVVCDPEGNTDSEELITANQQTVNGNTFYTSAGDKRFVSTKTVFKEVTYPVMFNYTEITNLESYNSLNSTAFPTRDALKMGLLPFSWDGDSAATLHNYHDILPYGGKGVYFHAPFSDIGNHRYKAYTDFNRNSYTTDYYVYGSGLKLTYPNAHGTLNPLFVEQYAYYQQWDYTIAYNANYPAGQTPDNQGYTGGDTVYGLVTPYGGHKTYNSNLFTVDNYVITSWNTKPDGTGTSYAVDYLIESIVATCQFMEPGITLYAQWERVVNFTLVEGGNGANPFATVTYTQPGSTEPIEDTQINETKTFKCVYGTEVSITNIVPASGYEFAYFTWNNNYKSDAGDVNLRLISDRILTNRNTYSFTIVAHSSMTAQFVTKGSRVGFYLDRNNKLLRSSEDPWQLYPTASSRTKTGVADDTVIDSALYYEYKSDTSYSITVSGSTYTALNTTHSVPYDDVLTLMTDSDGFVGWQINNKFVSYEPIYKHRVSCDATVTAVYSGTASASVNLLSNSADVAVIQRNAPNGYTLVESGFLLTTDATELTFEQLCDKSGVYRLTTTDKSINGTFKLRLKTGSYYGYGYAIYKDTLGNLVIVTTDWLSI